MNFHREFLIIILALYTVTLIGCQSRPDLEGLRSEILKLHKSEIEAHWKKNVDFFIRDLSKDYVHVRRGEILKPKTEDIRTELSNYLNITTFKEYRDLCEPKIGFSKDGSVAWSIVQVKVEGKQKTDEGSEKNLDFTCAYLTLYERQSDKWVILGHVSTFK